jgi:integrase/recombinase XerD
MDMQTIATYRPNVLDVIAGADHLAESTRGKYCRVVARYLDEGGDLFDPEQLAEYAKDLSNSGRAFLKAAVKLVSDQLVSQVKGMASPENVDAVQATLYRVDALQEAIQTRASKGRKAHTWLSQAQVKELLDTCKDGLQGKRDRLALGLLVAAGLRRQEAVELTFADVKLQPVKGKMRTVLDVEGKGAKNRVVPISDRLANAIDEWARAAGFHDGCILRSFDQSGELRDSLSAVGLFQIVQEHGAAIDKPELAPHDLRRTYAQLGYEAGVPITQISRLLGHASVNTTQRYLNLDLDLTTTVSDFVPF